MPMDMKLVVILDSTTASTAEETLGEWRIEELEADIQSFMEDWLTERGFGAAIDCRTEAQ